MIDCKIFFVLVAFASIEIMALNLFRGIQSELELLEEKSVESAELYEHPMLQSRHLLSFSNEHNSNEQKHTRSEENEAPINVDSSTGRNDVSDPGDCKHDNMLQLPHSNSHENNIPGRHNLELNGVKQSVVECESIEADTFLKETEKSPSVEVEETLPSKSNVNESTRSANIQVAAELSTSPMNQSPLQIKNSTKIHPLSFPGIKNSERRVSTENEVLQKKIRSLMHSESLPENCIDCDSHISKSSETGEDATPMVKISNSFSEASVNNNTEVQNAIAKKVEELDYSNKNMKSKSSIPLESAEIHSIQRLIAQSNAFASNPYESLSLTPREPKPRFCSSMKDCEEALNERCVSVGAVSVCRCGRGFARQPQTRKCEAQLLIEILLRLPYEEYNEDLKNRSSELYKEKRRDAIIMMLLLLGENPGLNSVIAGVDVYGFQKGSLIIHYYIILALGTIRTLSELIQQVQYQLKMALQIEQLMASAPFDVRNARLIWNTIVDACAMEEDNCCSKNADCLWDEVHAGGFTCRCKEGYIDNSRSKIKYPGERCEEPCTRRYCGTHGICKINKIGKRYCSCYANYSGVHCQEAPAGADPIPAFYAIGTLVTLGTIAACFACWRNSNDDDDEDKLETKLKEKSGVKNEYAVTDHGTLVALKAAVKTKAVAGISSQLLAKMKPAFIGKDEAVVGIATKFAVIGKDDGTAAIISKTAVTGKDNAVVMLTSKPAVIGKDDAMAMSSSKPAVIDKNSTAVFSYKTTDFGKDDVVTGINSKPIGIGKDDSGASIFLKPLVTSTHETGTGIALKPMDTADIGIAAKSITIDKFADDPTIEATSSTFVEPSVSYDFSDDTYDFDDGFD